ncbi:hypothetical protein PF005_g19075 [Phytophthora fragariae]|uniref:Uncharacterized protein n=1 Tax=Phytophthora fragariae TaxID=53985 RepID=A0A6A3WTP4_9STRA|nr:hypothetical protein PF005_g19075 [Phytophthora fragariae]
MAEARQVLVVKWVINVGRRNATLKKPIQYQGVPIEDNYMLRHDRCVWSVTANA